PVAEVAQPDRRLDQPLVEPPLAAVRLRPQVLPDLVGLEEIAGVEEAHARQVTRVVGFHTPLYSQVGPSVTPRRRRRPCGPAGTPAGNPDPWPPGGPPRAGPPASPSPGPGAIDSGRSGRS